MVQFLKGAPTGEIKAIEKLPEFVLIRPKEVKGFIWNMNEEEKLELKKTVRDTFEYIKKQILTDEWDMIILDEILGSISNGLISIEEVCDIINNKNRKIELILTGRNAPQELIELADYVSEINSIKHPIDKGISARKGIEY